MVHAAHPDLLHVVGRFDDPHTGAERSLPDLADALQGRRPVALWSEVPVHPGYAGRGVRMLPAPTDPAFPRGGSLLVGGVHVGLGPWLDAMQPVRVQLRYNLPNHQRLFEAIGRIRQATGTEPELVFVSRMLQAAVGLPGRVEPSLIRLDPFLGQPVEREPGRPVTVGRMSRDVPEKHDPQDLALYRMLAARGMRVRIMGGSCLAPWLGGVDGITLMAAGAEPAPQFLRSLDIFYYRTGSFVEPYGRVVLEAMASGLPVVAAANGGFAEQIRHGDDGLLVFDPQGAMQALQLLAARPALRPAIGAAARARALELHGPQAIARQLAHYLDEPDSPSPD